MKKYLLFTCLLLVASLFLTVGFSSKAGAFDPFPSTCTPTSGDGQKSPVCNLDGTDNPVSGKNGAITKIANVFALITSIFAVFIILVSGFEYVRSGGDSAKISKAKNGIIFALVGLIVVAVARSAVALAINKVSKQ